MSDALTQRAEQWQRENAKPFDRHPTYQLVCDLLADRERLQQEVDAVLAQMNELGADYRNEIQRLRDERDKWKRRAQAFKRGRLDALADHTRSICRNAIEHHKNGLALAQASDRIEAAEATLARLRALVEQKASEMRAAYVEVYELALSQHISAEQAAYLGVPGRVVRRWADELLAALEDKS